MNGCLLRVLWVVKRWAIGSIFATLSSFCASSVDNSSVYALSDTACGVRELSSVNVCTPGRIDTGIDSAVKSKTGIEAVGSGSGERLSDTSLISKSGSGMSTPGIGMSTRYGAIGTTSVLTAGSSSGTTTTGTGISISSVIVGTISVGTAGSSSGSTGMMMSTRKGGRTSG